MSLKKLSIIITIVICIFNINSCGNNNSKILLESGLSKELADLRSQCISNIKYELFFSIPKEKEKDINAHEKIFFTLKKEKLNTDLILDFKCNPDQIKNISTNDKKIKPTIHNEHIIIPSEYINEGENIVHIDFIAGNTSLNRNEDYLYTLLVPDRARTLFPCFDQPNLKAIYQLELNIPKDWEAVSNAPITNSHLIYDTRNTIKVLSKIANSRNNMSVSCNSCLVKLNQKCNTKRIIFKETEPLSTYLFSFVVGNFKKTSFTNKNTNTKVKKIQIFHRETELEKISQLKDIASEVFKSIAWLEHYTDIEYPFSKYDLIILPGFQFSGMEHSGATLYNRSQMFLPKTPSIDQRINRSMLIAHETAHMWFGDYVTMKWFNGVWIKEVFANFFAAEICKPMHPEIDFHVTDLNFYINSYSEDRTPGATSIEQKLPNLKYAGLIYNKIIYNKSPIFMDKLYHKIGSDAFRNSIVEYLNTYAYGNANWEDLKKIFAKNLVNQSKESVEDFNKFCDTWIYGKGLPQKSFSIKDEGRSDISEIPNLKGEYYGYIKLNGEALNLAVNKLYEKNNSHNFILSAVSRKAILMNLNENWINKNISNEKFLRVICSYLYEERDQQIFPLLLSYIENVALKSINDTNNYFSAEVEFAENALYNYIIDAIDKNFIKQSLISLGKIAQSPKVLSYIYHIWENEISHKYIILSHDDYVKISYDLAFKVNLGLSIENVNTSAKAILDEQRKFITNPDAMRGFDYISKVCTANDEEMDALFESLLEPENREIEPWTNTLLSFLNHPLRQDKAIKYIYPGLAELPEIQETGDIFFPSTWCNSLLKGHNTEASKKEINRFLKNNPKMLTLLKNKILINL